MLDATELARVLDRDGRFIGDRGQLRFGARENSARVHILSEHDHRADEAGGCEHRRGELLTARGAVHEDTSGGQRLDPALAHALLQRLALGVIANGVRDSKTCGPLVGDGKRDRFRAHRLADAARELLRESFQLELEDAHGVTV